MIEEDVVNPPHYRRFAIEPVDFIMKNDLGYAEGNVVKYVCRWQHKNGVEDLIKARSYLDKLIAHEQAKDLIKIPDGSVVPTRTPFYERPMAFTIAGPYDSPEEREAFYKEWDPQP